jgi:hypothetical protein
MVSGSGQPAFCAGSASSRPNATSPTSSGGRRPRAGTRTTTPATTTSTRRSRCPGPATPAARGTSRSTATSSRASRRRRRRCRNGRYGGIIRALDGSPQQLASAISSSPWGTHNPNLASIIARGQGTKPAGSYGSGSSASPQVDTTQSSAIDSGAASVDAAGAQQAKLSYLENSHDPNALLTLAATLKQTGSAAGGIGGTQQGYSSPAAGDPGLQSEDQLRQHTTAGAAAALSWANSKVGDPSSRESGVNAGGLAGELNKRFGMSNQPWCAMFTSLAVVKGGAPRRRRPRRSRR